MANLMRKMFTSDEIVKLIKKAMSDGQIPTFKPINRNDVKCITDAENNSLQIIFPKYVFPYYIKLEDEDGNYVIIQTDTDNTGEIIYDIKLDEGNTLTNEGVTWDGEERFIIECGFDNDTHEYNVVELLYYIYVQS